MSQNYDVQLQSIANGLVVPTVGVWVQLVNNDTGTAYVSTGITSGTGKATFSPKPPGDTYVVNTSAVSSSGPWTAFGVSNWAVPVVQGDNPAFQSVSTMVGSPYAPLAGLTPGGMAITNRWVLFTPSGGDDSSALQTLITNVNAAGGGTIYCMPGTYTVKNVNVKSNVAIWAEPGTVTFKTTTASTNILQNTTGTLDSVTIHGINFDCTGVGWSSIVFNGSDAAGQITNLLIRSCQFKNPSTTWMIQISYIIVDPAIPSSKNSNIRIEDCTDDATGQTFTLENLILINCQDVLIQGNRFLNAPVALGAHVAIYGYNRNIRFIGNYALNFLCARAIYIEQSDGVQVLGDQFRTTANQYCVTVFNSKNISVLGCDMTTGTTGGGVQIKDFGGSTFDAHTNLYAATTGVKVQDNRMDAMSTCVLVDHASQQGQSDIFVEGNFVSPLRNLFANQSMPASPAATSQRWVIRGNHVISHSGFTGTGCVSINGNASATNGGLQNIVVADNFFPLSGAGSGCDIEITGKADDVLVYNNRCLSAAATSLSIVAVATNVRQYGNIPQNAASTLPGGYGVPNIAQAPVLLSGQTAAVASVATLTAPNDGITHVYRVSGSVTITTLGSGNINLEVSYTDDNGVAHANCIIPVSADAGTFAASATTANDYKGHILIRANPNTAVTVLTAGTFTGCTYKVWGLIEQLA